MGNNTPKAKQLAQPEFSYQEETEQQQATRLLNTFNGIDVDKSGSLSLSELTLALERLSLPGYHASEIFNEADVNNDGKISFDEFRAYCMRMEKELLVTFKKFDVSNTNTITSSDLKHVLNDL